MLTITIPSEERWDPIKELFVTTTKAISINMEHSLVAISKWESKYHKPFLSNENFSESELRYYFKCMTLTQNVPEDAYDRILESGKLIKQIQEYIADSHTATRIKKNDRKANNGRKVTSELIYHWMFASGIPINCEKWHLSRLLTLIEVISEENKPKKKMSRSDVLNQNRAINAARRKH